jgi:hypothetical protein
MALINMHLFACLMPLVFTRRIAQPQTTGLRLIRQGYFFADSFRPPSVLPDKLYNNRKCCTRYKFRQSAWFGWIGAIK